MKKLILHDSFLFNLNSLHVTNEFVLEKKRFIELFLPKTYSALSGT